MTGRKLGKWMLIGSLLVAVAVIGVAGLGVVGVAAQTLGPGNGGFFRGRMGHWGGRQSALLADELGVTVEQLQAAHRAAREAALAEAVEAGHLTEDEAALMLARLALHDYFDPHAVQAEILGISPEDLATRPMHTWIEELDIDIEAFQAEMEAARAAALAQAVADGVISQAQADALLEGGWGPMMWGAPRGGIPGRGMRGRLQGNGTALRGRGNCPMSGIWD